MRIYYEFFFYDVVYWKKFLFYNLNYIKFINSILFGKIVYFRIYDYM